MKMKLIFWLIGLIVLLSSVKAIGQTDFTLYHMKLVPYRIYLNPALTPQARSFVGTPGIGSIYFNANNAFSYNDLLTRESDDSLKVDFNKFLNKLSDKNSISSNINLDVFSFGFQAFNKYYVSFSISEHSIINAMYPKDLINLAWNGNVGSIDNEISLSPSFNAMIYNEFAIGITKNIDEKLSVGFRVKLLNGQANIHSETAKLNFYTDPFDYSYRMNSDISIKTSGIDNSGNRSTSDMLKGGNLGFGVDLGASYNLNDKISFSASLLNLGSINWKKQLLSLKSKNSGQEVIFDGIAIKDFSNNGKSLGDAFQAVLDSLSDKFKIDTLYNQSYKTILPMSFYAGADYKINEKNVVGLLFHGQVEENLLHPAFSLSYYTQLGRMLGLSASYNIMYNSYSNIGLGFSLNLGSVQIYSTTDNIFAIINYKNAQTFNIHSGLVWTFGRKPIDNIN